MINVDFVLRSEVMQTGVYEIAAQGKDLGGGVHIHRYLPDFETRAVGPFVFFDYMPQIAFAAGQGTDVRPHPHIGLSTLSWIFDGQMHHRDSLDYDLVITPGDVLLMTSGRGIVHSERTPQAYRQQPHHLHMVQFWLALPQADEKVAPSVQHTLAAEIPGLELGAGLQAKLALGEFEGVKAPAQTYFSAFLLDCLATSAGAFELAASSQERALFLVQGQLSLAGQSWRGPHFICLDQAAHVLHYSADSRFLILGGDPLDGPRHLWWNFVASDASEIEAAKVRWQEMSFGSVAGDPEFIPLPE